MTNSDLKIKINSGTAHIKGLLANYKDLTEEENQLSMSERLKEARISAMSELYDFLENIFADIESVIPYSFDIPVEISFQSTDEYKYVVMIKNHFGRNSVEITMRKFEFDNTFIGKTLPKALSFEKDKMSEVEQFLSHSTLGDKELYRIISENLDLIKDRILKCVELALETKIQEKTDSINAIKHEIESVKSRN